MADTSFNSSPSEGKPPSGDSVTTGVKIDANEISTGGDVVGRDKFVINIPWIPVVVVLILVMLIVVIVIIWSPWRPSPAIQLPAATASLTPAPTETPAIIPSPTPVHAPTAIVQAFATARGAENSIFTPRETISVTVGESIRIRAEVVTNIDRKDLLFTWLTCRTGQQIVVWGNGVFEMTYKVPQVNGPDCVRVKVEKGGMLLDDSFIFVNVQS